MRRGAGVEAVGVDIGCWGDGRRWEVKSAMRFTRGAWRITAVFFGLESLRGDDVRFLKWNLIYY